MHVHFADYYIENRYESMYPGFRDKLNALDVDLSAVDNITVNVNQLVTVEIPSTLLVYTEHNSETDWNEWPLYVPQLNRHVVVYVEDDSCGYCRSDEIECWWKVNGIYDNSLEFVYANRDNFGLSVCFNYIKRWKYIND